MPDWLTYRPEDLLLFSPRVYWRLFELHNAALWPLQLPALLSGAAILAWLLRPRPWSDRAIPALLAAAWVWVGWSFLWSRYATINWAATYVAPAFALEALLLLWLGSLRGRLRFAMTGTLAGVAGLVLFLHSLVLHPLLAPAAGRPLRGAEVFGIAPDPTAIATLGLLTIGARGAAAWVLLPIPLAWCAVSWTTLATMGSPQGWIPAAAAGVALAARLWPGGARTLRRS